MQEHITVLTHEAIEALNIRQDSIIVDATLGAGGHSREILPKLSKEGIFVGIDADPTATESIKFREPYEATVHLRTGNFRHIDSILDELHIPAVDGVLADLGWRMEQFSGNGKGFSFSVDEPLIMTYGDESTYPFVAGDIVNDWKEEDIKNVLKGYGEERFAGRIARKVVEARKIAPITRSVELREIVREAVPGFYRTGKVHPATKTFQALRIAVNDELDALTEFIEKSVKRLLPKGRLVIITFHSLEDRIVKHSFKAYALEGLGTVLTKKPMTPTKEELKRNPRSRSAKMRIFEKHE